MNAFTSKRFIPLYKHVIHYRMLYCKTPACEFCKCGWEIIKKGTGWLLKALILKKDRRLAGSDTIGISLGEMGVFDAIRISEDENITLEDELRNSFPGLDLIKHVGGDLHVRCNEYTLILKHADEMYDVLRQLYNSFIYENENIPVSLSIEYITFCFHISNIIVTNPNSVWELISNNLVKDIINIANHI